MIYLVFSFKHSASYKDLGVVNYIQTLQKFLPEAYKNSKLTIWQSHNKKFLIASWENSNIFSEGKKSYACTTIMKHPVKGSLLCSGHARDGVIRARTKDEFPYIFEMMQVTDSTVKLSDTPGGAGTYNWLSPNEQTLVSWNTQPPVYPLFIGKNNIDFCVVGNRVLLVAMASSLSDRLKPFNSSYLQSYIPAGYALDGETIYNNVEMLPANKSVTCQNGDWRLTDYVLDAPEIIPQEMPLEDKSALMADALIKSFDVFQDFDSSIFWLSGGKDSRTVAAVLANLRIKSRAISFGSKEYDYAKPVADICGADYEIHDMRVLTDPIQAAMMSNKITEGLGTAAAHQYNFQYPSLSPNFLNVHGHGHLLRGGFARVMKLDENAINRMLKSSFLSGFITDDGGSKIISDLKSWEATRDFKDPRDKLYWAHHDLRLGANLAPQIMDYVGKSFMLFPLLDEQVARMASGLFMYDKVSERVLFGAIKQLCPELCELPLFSEGWRFDRSPDKRDFLDSNHNFQDTFDKRHTQPITTVDKNKNHFIREGNINHSQSLKIRNQSIIESSIYYEVKTLLAPEAIALIEARASGANDDTAYFSSLNSDGKFTLNSLIDRVFIASTLYDSDWL